MKYCPISYEKIKINENYSRTGLRSLSPKLKLLHPLNYSAAEQRSEALTRAGKMSIQGVQTKLSAQLKVKEGKFELVEQYGHYILKPQSEHYTELPENEAITMTMAKMINLEVPVHGLVFSKDNSLTYFIKRFDRTGHSNKLAVEDFTQLSGFSRDTKYNSSMEKVAKVVMQFCTFPKVEAMKLLKLTLFNFLIGNEDMHLKNFSLITRENIVTLSPVYDLLNTSIALRNFTEELALPLNGRKNNLRKKDFLDYFGVQVLGLNQLVIQKMHDEIFKAVPIWKELISRSFLSSKSKAEYVSLLEERLHRLFD